MNSLGIFSAGGRPLLPVTFPQRQPQAGNQEKAQKSYGDGVEKAKTEHEKNPGDPQAKQNLDAIRNKYFPFFSGLQEPGAAFNQEKSKQVDYLFKKALSTLRSLAVPNKPSLFLVYAHDNPAHAEKAEANISSYLINELSQIRANLYSDQTPMGKPYLSSPEDLKKDGKLEDILTSQLCLLPDQLRDDVKPVDKVVVCCSELLGRYLRWPHYEKFYQQIQEAYFKDREAYRKNDAHAGTSAIRQVVRQFSQEEAYKADFHHVLTEMAFLQIRAEHSEAQHGIIPISLTINSYQQCLAHFIPATTVRMEDILRFEVQAKSGIEVYPNQSRHLLLFKLIERLLVGSNEAQTFLGKFWHGYNDCIKSSALGTLEFANLLDGIFADIDRELRNQLVLNVQEQQRKELESKKEPLAILGENIKKEYFTTWRNLVEIQDGLAMYVALECSFITNTKERFSLEEKVKEFLVSGEKKVLLLLGEAGSGKSTFNRYLARSLWETYDKETNKSSQTPIPLFIPLSSLKEPNDNLIAEYLIKMGLKKSQIADLKENYRFIFILDGYDEIKDRTRLFYIENKLDQWKAKVIITSRPEYFGNGYECQFHPKGQAYLLQAYRLSPFSDLTIEEYVNKYKNAYPELEKNIVEHGEILKQPEVKELVRNPFLLKMALSELPALSQKYKNSGQRITRIALYDQFVESWFKRSQDRLRDIRLTHAEQKAFDFLNKAFIRHGTKFSKDLAIAMYQAGLVSVAYSEQLSYDQSDAVEKDWRDKFLSDRNEQVKLLRFNAPLICQDDRYQFIHKSIQDYLVARAMWEELENASERDASSGAEPLNEIKNVRLIWEALDPAIQVDTTALLNRFNLVEELAVQSFLVERVQQNRALVKLLLTWIKASTSQDTVSTAAANAITILVRAGVQFNGMDLQGIQILGADLSYGVFDSVQLQGADLSKTNLTGIWLRNAGLTGACMEGVQFGELPSLQLEESVDACCYSPDGRYLVAALGAGLWSGPGRIALYEVETLAHVHTFEGHTSLVTSVAFSPDGQTLASGSDDKMVRLWSVAEKKPLHTFEGHINKVTSVAFSPDGQMLASCSGYDPVQLWLPWHMFGEHSQTLASGSGDNTVRLWSVVEKKPLHTFEGYSSYVTSVAFSPDGQTLALGSGDNTVRLWSVAEKKLLHTFEGHSGYVTSVAFSPDGQTLASGSDDDTVRLWSVAEKEPLHTFKGHTSGVKSVAFSPDGQTLASGSVDDTVRLWSVAEKKPLHMFEGHISLVTSVAFSSNGQTLASGSIDGTVRLWSVAEKKPLHTFEEHTDYATSVAFSPDGQMLASGSRDKTMRLWSVAEKKLWHTFEGHIGYVTSVAFSSNGQTLASGSIDNTMRLWSVAEKKSLHTFKHTHRVTSVAFSPDGQMLASGSGDNTMRLWSVAEKKLWHTFEGHSSYVASVVFSPDGQTLASGSYDNTVRLWSVAEKKPLHTFKEHTHYATSVAFSSDGKTLASGSRDKTVRLWSIAEKKPLHTLKGHTYEATSVAFSPDDQTLASGSGDHTVRLWSTTSGQCLTVIQGFNGAVNSVAWYESAEGVWLATGSSDKAIRLWKVHRDGEMCRVTLHWASAQTTLTTPGMSIQDVIGLSAKNIELLKQRGAKGEPHYTEEQEARPLLTERAEAPAFTLPAQAGNRYGSTYLNFA